MATLQEYMNRRNALSSSYDRYLSGTPRAKAKSFWQEEDVATALYRQRREMEERREASRRELEEQIRRAQQNSITPVKQGSDAGFLEKTGETVLDVFGNILSGASKALEGVFDLGISGVGAIGGIFDKGFRDEMRRWVEYDVTGQHVQANFDKWSDDSVLNNSKAGQITENVLRGVGQMLPTVAVSIATGGAALPAMLTVGASAAGNATEEAFNDGADYYRGLGYGVVSGGVEMLTEKALGGLGGVIGPGYLDNVIRSTATRTAATGVRRVLKEAAGEAAEEAVAELVNPLAKSIYKGRDALDDYSKAEYWQGVGESALVGGLTSAAYGGTVGRAMKASGKYGDVRETVDDIKANRQKRANLDAHDKWTDAREEAFHKREVANYRQIEKILQSATPKQRATIMKQNGLDGAFDADGSLTADFLRSLGENVIDGQMDTQGENGAQGAPTGATAGKTYFSLKNGVVHIDTDQEIFEGVDKENIGRVVRDYMKQRFRGTTVEDVNFTSRSEREYTNSKETQRLYNKEPDGYDAKMRASTELDNFIRSAKLIGHEDAKHPKNFNTGGYDRYDVQFVLNGNAFSGQMLVANGEKGRQFYDIVNIKSAPHIDEVSRNGSELVGMGSADGAPHISEVSRQGSELSGMGSTDGSRGQVVTREADGSPYPTSETFRADATNNSIPQNPDLSTASGEKVSGKYDTQGERAAQSVQFRFKEGKENRNQDLVDFYQSVLSMKDNAAKNKRKKKIGVVTQEHATLVSDLIKKETGKTIDLSDYEIWINGSAVNHIEDRHGKNGAADKSMADMDNVARIPWALDNATSGEVLKKDDGNLDLDYNYKNSDGSPSVKVRISKEVDNGLLFVAECVPDTNEKKLHILSAYMQQKSSEGQELTHKTQSPPQPTSETVLDSNTATNSIPQNTDLSTASGEKSSGNYDHKREVANYRQIEKILQNATPKQRATIMKQNGLDGAFDADGSLTADFLRSLGENVIDGQTDTQGENGAQGVDFSLKGKRADGIEVYETDEQTKKLPYKERRQKFMDVMANEYRGRTAKFVKNGQAYYATFEDADVRKNIYGDNKSDNKGWAAKVNTGADGSIFELVENARYDHSSRERGKTNSAHKGVGVWDYFVKRVQIDGTVFDEVINVRQKADGEYVYNIQLNENTEVGTAPSHIPMSESNHGVLKSDARDSHSDNSIPQNPDLSTASGEKSSGNFDHRFMSPDLWHREGEVDADLKAISKRSGTQAKVFSDELSEGAKKNYRKTKKALNALNAAGGNGVSLVITEPSDTYKGGLVNGRTIYMPADQLESGDWAGTLVHEFTHFEEGTKEYSEMMDYLQSDDILVDDGKGGRAILRDVAEQAVQGKGYGFDAEALRTIVDKADAGERLTAEEAKALRAYTSEVTAHETEIMLGNEGFIDRIVRQNGSAAERLVGKLLSLDKAFSKMGDKQAKAQRDKIREAERLYLKAATAAGNGSIRKMILSHSPELEDEETLTRMNEKNMQVSGETVQYNLKDKKIPTREELESKPPMMVVDISKPQTQGSFAERRKQILSKAGEIIKKPHLNRDTNTRIFITSSSYSHAFSNGGEIHLNAVEHLPELIENAVLTHGEMPTHGSDHTDGVYTFFAAAKNGKNTQPVKLKVKEYKYSGQDMPKNIKEFFGDSPQDYASSYDTVVLEVDEIEESLTGSAKDMDTNDPFQGPEKLSTISIADLLDLVKGDAKKYIPVHEKKTVQLSLKEDANQQTTDVFSNLLASAGIEGEALEIRGDLAELYRIANESDEDNDAFVGRVANRIAMEMARKGTPQNGETQDEMTERLRKEILARTDFAEAEKALKTAPKVECITAVMSEDERSRVLKKRKLANIPNVESLSDDHVSAIINDIEGVEDFSGWKDINRYSGKTKRLLIEKVAKEFGALSQGKTYENADVKIEFMFSNNNFNESFSKQKKNYEIFAKMFSCFDDIIAGAVGIEVHNRNETYKTDPTLKNIYVLMSAFRDGDSLVPVKLEIKEFKDKANSLYVAIALDKIKITEVTEQGNTQKGVTQNSTSVTISISDLMQKVNPENTNFTKYFPPDMWTNEQFSALRQDRLLYSEKGEVEVAERIRLRDEAELKSKKTGYTYDDVNSMLDGIRKGGALDFETASGVIEGQIFRNDRWELGKRIYETLKMNELGNKRELSRKIASMIVDTVKVNEKGADGKTVARRLSDVLGKDGIADAKEAIALDVAAALGDRDAKKYNKRMNDLKYAAEQLSNMKKGKYVNAANYKGNTFEKALSELARMNWHGGLVSAGKLRERFVALSRWYTPNNPLYGIDGKANENYRRSIAEALDFVSETSRGAFTLEDIDAAEMVVKYFKREIENYGTIFKNGKRVEAEPEVKRYIANIDRAKTIAERSSIMRGILHNPLARLAADPAMLMREADSYLEGGFFSEQFEELRRGTIDAAVLEHELTADFVSFWEKNKAYAKRYNDTEVKYGDKTIPLQEAIMLYMTMKREHAFAGLAYAGFEIEGKKATVNISDGFADLVEKARVELMNKLPPEKALTMTQKEIGEVQEKAIAQAVAQMREELYRQFTAEDKRLISIMERGYEACREVKVKNDNTLMGYSNVVGGYYCPVKRAGLAESVDIMSMFEGDRVSNLSFNKDTVKNAHKLLIEPAHIVFMRHVKAMALYDGLGVFTDNFNRLYNLNVGESANNAITIRSKLAQSNNFVKDMMPYFKELKQDVEGISKKRSSERFYNDAVAMIRSSYATYQLGFNPKTWASQLSSLIASTVKVDMDCLMRGFSVSGKDVDDYCKLAWLRNNDGDAVLAQSVTSGLNPVQMASRNALQKVRDVSMLPIGKVDRFVVEKLFSACQVQVEKQNGLKVGSKENKIEAGKMLEHVILETQQNSLATERTAAMRSGDELLKGFNMFIADAMKVQARMIEPYARMSALRTQKRIARDAGNTEEMARLDKEIEAARKECVRATSVLVGVALFNALLAYGFKWLYRRDEEESVRTVTADMVGNMIGGIPFVRDAYTLLIDGFEADNFAISTFNDVLKTTADTAQLLQDAAEGREVTEQEAMRAVRDVLYATGQLSGVPVRNLYNNVTGVINRISPKAQYRIDNIFYKQSYAKDLQAAIEVGDERMISLIASMMIEDKVGDVDKALSDGLRSLVEGGYDVLPRAVGDSITYDGEETVLTKRQRKRFKEVYGIAEEQIVSMMKLPQYKEADDEVRAKAIKLIWEAYYDLAVDDVLGVDSCEKNVLFAEAIDMDKLALIIATARGIKADVGANGKVINGSRLAKIEAYIEGLKLKAAQKHMLLGYLGYRNGNGEDKVRAYINTLSRLSREEKQALLIYSGYAA